MSHPVRRRPGTSDPTLASGGPNCESHLHTMDRPFGSPLMHGDGPFPPKRHPQAPVGGWTCSPMRRLHAASGRSRAIKTSTGLTLHRLGYERCMPSALESLSNIPLFADLSARQLRKVLKSAGEDRYEEGDVIVSEGGRTQTLFVILEGTARVVRNHRTVARRSVGEFFGEISMIDLRQRSATVIAESPMRCLALYHDDLRKLVMGDPQVAWSLVQTLASRLRDDWERPLDRKRATRPGVSRGR